MALGVPGPRKRPAAVEPSNSGDEPKTTARKPPPAAAVVMSEVRSTWSESGVTTLASRRDEIAKSTGADSRDKIVVAPLSAEVPSVFGVDLSSLSYVAAMVWKKRPSTCSRSASRCV